MSWFSVTNLKMVNFADILTECTSIKELLVYNILLEFFDSIS